MQNFAALYKQKNKTPHDKNPKSGKKKRQLFTKKNLKIVGILFGIGLAIILGIFIYFAKDLPSPNNLNIRNVAESTKIYDSSGDTLLYEIHGEEKRTSIPINEMSDYVKDATLAAEDANFYKHFGFDPKGIARSVFSNATSDTQIGGSTITQQLVKNSILTSEKTYTRKLKELILSIEVELKFSKEEILEMYLNHIPYGSNSYGIEAASESFFGKRASDLSLAEAATLASLPQAPTRLSPFGANPDMLEERKNWIIDRMVELDYIDQNEAESAKQEEVHYVEKSEGIIAPHFVTYVREQLATKFGEQRLAEGGMKVYTTLNIDLQHIAEKVVPEGVTANQKYNASNAALVAINPTNGHILAMQGSKDYFDRDNDGNVNVAVRERQPGSSFKPFAYAAALKKGYTPDTIVIDAPTDFGSDYKPNNYDMKFRGPVTFRDSLAGSLNVPAVKALYLAGLNETIDLAKNMGMNTLTDPDRYGLSLVLGGGEVKLLEEAAAFGVFANDGTKNETTAILKVQDNFGEIILDNTNVKDEQVLDPQIARQINSILSDEAARNKTFGNNSALNLGRPVAVKTGTTQEYRDAWTMGYTPNLVTGVWVGNNDNTPMTNGAAGVYAAAPIWNSFMRQALEKTESTNFQGYDPINVQKPILKGHIPQETKVEVCLPSGLLANETCPSHLREERIFKTLHSILYYVEKDNPRGDYPQNPAADPQYEKWETGVKSWAASANIVYGNPPTEYDDSHKAANKPSISITSPKNNAFIEGNSVTIKTKATAPLGIAKVEFFVDGSSFNIDTEYPYEATYKTTNLSPGYHTFTTRAYDPADNRNESSITIQVKGDSPISISITSPSGSTTANSSDFPMTVSAKTGTNSNLSNVTFYLQPSSGGNTTSFGSSKANGKTSFSTNLTNPGAGNYAVYAVATSKNGQKSYSSKVGINVLE